LSFKYKRKLPYGKRGINFRKQSAKFRGRGVTFSNDGVSNIEFHVKEDPINLNNKGVEYYNKGKYKLAMHYFSKALDVAPQFDTARVNREYCFKMLREKRRKKEEYIKEKRAKRLGAKSSSVSTFNVSQSQRNIDYNREKYNMVNQYGRIPSNTSNTTSSEYYTELYSQNSNNYQNRR
jgi:tetratricopeptide (TPR) repeat protein